MSQRCGSSGEPEKTRRYRRQVILPRIGPSGQRRLAEARVLVAGLGGLGSPVCLYLAGAGVGALGLADYDVAEEENLNRQFLYNTSDAGKIKTELARQRLDAFNPHCVYEEHPAGLHAGNALEIVSRYDLIVDATDNFVARYLINDAAFFARKPVVYGGLDQFRGVVTVFHPAAGGPCLRCLFPQPPAPGEVPDCQEAGVFGPLCGVIGGLQAAEALKPLLNFGTPLQGRLLDVDVAAMDIRSVQVKADPACLLCGEQPAITRMDPENYQQTGKTGPG